MKKILILLTVLFGGFFTTYNLMAYEKVENDYVLYSTYENNNNGIGEVYNDMYNYLEFVPLFEKFLESVNKPLQANDILSDLNFETSISGDFILIDYSGFILSVPRVLTSNDSFVNIEVSYNYDNAWNGYNLMIALNSFDGTIYNIDFMTYDGIIGMINVMQTDYNGWYWSLIIGDYKDTPPVVAEPWYHGLKSLLDFVTEPFLYVLDGIGISDTIIKLGFGNVEWFSISLYSLTQLILNVIVIWLVLRLFYRLMKLLTKIITGGYVNV